MRHRVLALVPNLFTIAAVTLLAACYVSPFTDLDFTWQIRTGEQIVQTGQLRTTDAFTYTIAGQTVNDFEWLFEVVLYALWVSGGAGALHVFKTVLIVAPMLAVAWQLRRREVPWHIVCLVCWATLIVLRPSWNLRAMSCTTVGLILVGGWLRDHCTGGRQLTWWLPAVMLMWANLHPGVIAGLGLLALVIGWEWANRWLRWNEPLSWNRLGRLTWLGGLGVVMTFLSPAPWARLMYPFQPELRHPIMRIFVEMQPLWSFAARGPGLLVGVYVLTALVGLSVAARLRAYRLWEVAVLVGLAILAHKHIRGLQDWVWLMVLLGLPHVCWLVRGFVRRDMGGALFEGWWWRPQRWWLGTAWVVLVVLAGLGVHPGLLPPAEVCPCPSAAVGFIERHELRGRFFAPPNFGAYLGWRLREQAHVYVDTRGFFFPPVLLEDSHYLPQMRSDWRRRLQRVVEEYETDYLLLETTGPRAALWQWLRRRGVRPMYCDGDAVLVSVEAVRPVVGVKTASR